MTYVLYGDIRSGSATVELALAEIGAQVELRDVPLEKNAQLSDQYGSLNPQRKLPTLITPEGETLTETVAILLTLDERHGDAKLAPAPASPDRARMLRWLLYVATELYPVIEMKDYPDRFQPEGADTPRARLIELEDHYRRIWKERWLRVEREAHGAPWFLKEGFSILDIYIGVVSRWAQIDDWRARHLPRVDAIARAVALRPRCADVWKRHFEEI